MNARLRFLIDVGLHYLTLDRAAGTLAGERRSAFAWPPRSAAGWSECCTSWTNQHRPAPARQSPVDRDVGPPSGSRQHVDRGEHDEDTIRASDWVVDIGPAAGEHGGQVVVSGPLEGAAQSKDSITGACLAGRRSIEVPPIRRAIDSGRKLTVHDAREHNLRNVTVDFPLGVLVAVRGIPGPASRPWSTMCSTPSWPELHSARRVPGRHRTVTSVDNLDKVVHVDQAPRRTPLEPATYTGVFDHIRRLFAEDRAKIAATPRPVLVQCQGWPV